MAKENYTPEEKKTLKKMFWNSRLVFSSFNMVKMEGNAFALTMEPALDELYKDKKRKKQRLCVVMMVSLTPTPYCSP